jgi:hypothetical protein
LQEEVAHKIEWYAANPEYFSNTSFHQRDIEGLIEALRYLGVPEWFIQGVMKVSAVIWPMRFVRRFAQRSGRHREFR